MLKQWISKSLTLASKPADFYCGGRKIIQAQRLNFTSLDDTLQLSHAGYTKHKMSHLRRGYFHEESHSVAMSLWERRLGKRKYGSVGFTTYNHFIKNDPNKKSIRASVMGPCIQSVCLTLNPSGSTNVDVFYRTTEIFKKFPADLIFLRDELLQGFRIDSLEMMTCHFANVTVHPMYFVTLIPELDDPIAELEKLKIRDKYFFDWVVKWTARYVCPEYHRGIAKFAQAMRVHADAHARIDKSTMKPLQRYLVANHPGYRNDYEGDEEDDAD